MSYSLIREAIGKKQNISATYNKHHREMSPHVIGTKNGREQALLYQFGGTSSSGLQPDGSPDNWRCIPISGMEDVTVIGGEFHPPPNHSRPQFCVGEIDVEVQF